jgi:hypothetical membrane protein
MRILALGGVAGPAIFAVVMLVSAALRPRYSHLTNLISELGATHTPHAALMNYAGFVPAGLMLAAFGLALARVLPQQRLVMAAAVLVTLFGCGMAASGVFSCDPGCPQTGGSVEHAIHDRIAPIIFLGLIVGVAILGVQFRRLPAWGHLASYSLLTSAFAFLFMVALVSSLETRTLSGLWQRLMLAALLLWCAIIGVGAYRSPASP